VDNRMTYYNDACTTIGRYVTYASRIACYNSNEGTLWCRHPACAWSFYILARRAATCQPRALPHKR